MHDVPADTPKDSATTPTPEQLQAICQRALGISTRVLAARELMGGTFNRVWLMTLSDQQVILRVAPPPAVVGAWHEQALLRREHAMQPFFAALADRIPRTLLADFTHQIIARDYVVQTVLPGERWDTLAEHFAAAEEQQLWAQFGTITKTIHATTGTHFGGPAPLPVFPTWSATIIHLLEQALAAMRTIHLDTAHLTLVRDYARRYAAYLNVVTQPRLLHGDLWLFNLLVTQDAAGPMITGVLDADRAWWGDPLADWTMFVLAQSATPDTALFYQHFWQAYGPGDALPRAAFRTAIYHAMHMGIATEWAARHADTDTLARGHSDMAKIAHRLPMLVQPEPV